MKKPRLVALLLEIKTNARLDDLRRAKYIRLEVVTSCGRTSPVVLQSQANVIKHTYLNTYKED